MIKQKQQIITFEKLTYSERMPGMFAVNIIIIIARFIFF